MDILSHGLWAGAAAKAVNRQGKNRITIYWAMLWGVFPDLFAFTVPFAWMIWHIAIGDPVPFPRHDDLEPVARDTVWPFELAARLYNISHSAVVFVAIIAVVILLRRYGPWMLRSPLLPLEMGGWLLHIVMDFPTHTYRFFPTPILWPISEWKFDGISWGTPWFLITNYSILLLIYAGLWLWYRKKVDKERIKNFNNKAFP